MTSFFPHAWKEMTKRQYHIPDELTFWTGVWQILHDDSERESDLSSAELFVDAYVTSAKEKKLVLDGLSAIRESQLDSESTSTQGRAGLPGIDRRNQDKPSPIMVLWCQAHKRDPQIALDSYWSATSDGPTLSISKYGFLDKHHNTPPKPGEPVSEIALRTHTACETEYNRRMEPIRTAGENLPTDRNSITHKE